MTHITANELKTKGVSVVQSALEKDNEAIITVHGKPKYVVLDVELYNHLREYELDMALAEVKEDLQQGRYQIDDIDAHIQQVTKANN